MRKRKEALCGVVLALGVVIGMFGGCLGSEEKESIEGATQEFRKAQKNILKFLSNPDNVTKLVEKGFTPEQFEDFMRTYFPTTDELKDLLTNDEKYKEIINYMARGAMVVLREDLEHFYGKCYNKRWGDETKEIWEDQYFDTFEKRYNNYRNQGESVEDAVKKATPIWWDRKEWNVDLEHFFDDIEDLSENAEIGLKYLLDLTNQAVKGGMDWDPEWEETWYWEGWDYPQTDLNYEEYPYVDEHGAYDWTKG
jgi:hypothetical protein